MNSLVRFNTFLDNFSFINDFTNVRGSTDDKQFKLELDLPGLQKDSINIEVDGKYLNIKAKYKRNGEYSCRYYVGDSVDFTTAAAGYEDGVLTITVDKAEKEKEKIKITVN